MQGIVLGQHSWEPRASPRNIRTSFGGLSVLDGKGLNFGSACNPVSSSQRLQSSAIDRFTRPRHAVSSRVRRRRSFDTKTICAMPTVPSQTALEQSSDPKSRSRDDAAGFTAQPSKQECRWSAESASRSSTQSVQRLIIYGDSSSFELLRKMRKTETLQEVCEGAAYRVRTYASTASTEAILVSGMGIASATHSKGSDPTEGTSSGVEPVKTCSTTPEFATAKASAAVAIRPAGEFIVATAATAAGTRFNWKHCRQSTGRPCVGLKGTVVSIPHAEHSVRVSVRESGSVEAVAKVGTLPTLARFDLHNLQRLGSFLNCLSKKNNCSPAVKTNSVLQSEHFRSLSI